MFDLKPLSTAAIPRAIAKAEHYRLLNEPRQAESICRDVLRADDENQDALVIMLLALTDQFGRNMRVNVNHAEEVLPRLTDEYLKIYYTGVIAERWAKSVLDQGLPGSVCYDWLCKAMAAYERAETASPSGNDDAILRWNTCARIIKRNDQIRPAEEDHHIEAGFGDEVPMR